MLLRVGLSCSVQLQHAHLLHAEHPTTTPSTPPTTCTQPQQTSVCHSPTPGRTPCHSGAVDGRYSNPVPIAQAPERHTSHQFPAAQAQAPEQSTPQAGDRLDATGQVLRIGDEVSFLATNYTAGGTATIQRFTAMFVILRRKNGCEVHCTLSNVTRLHTPLR